MNIPISLLWELQSPATTQFNYLVVFGLAREQFQRSPVNECVACTFLQVCYGSYNPPATTPFNYLVVFGLAREQFLRSQVNVGVT